MSDGEHEQWLYRGDKGCVEPFSSSLESAVSGSSSMDRTEEEHLPKDYEAIRSWVEYSKSKTWLLDASRVSDQSTTLSTPPQEHQGEVEKWLVGPTVDTLATQLQVKLFVSSENAPWLMSCTPKDDGNTITGQFSAVLSSPNSQWLCKYSSKPDELSKWILEQKKPHLTSTSSFGREGVDWLAFPVNQEHVHDGPDTKPENNDASGEEDNLTHFPSVAPTSLPLPDTEKWLLPSSSPSFSSLPLFESSNPVGAASTLNQWLP